MKKLLILSGKGGTGKTTTAAAFVSFSKATAFADCDVDAPNLHLVVGENGEPSQKDFLGGKKATVDAMVCNGCGKCVEHCRFEAITLRQGKAHIDDISCEGCGVCRFVCPTQAVTLTEDVAGTLSLFRSETCFSTAELKMGRGNSGKLVTEVKFALFGAAKDEPLAIIDGSPGIGCPVIASISGVDLVLVVAEPTVSGVSDLKRLFQSASILRVPLAVCVNKWDVSEQKTEEIEAFCKENAIDFVGKIPFDKTVSYAINENRAISEIDCPAQSALFSVYQNTMQLLANIKNNDRRIIQ